MFTVVFLDSNSMSLMAEYRSLFLPFIDNGDIAFCNWNPSGTDVKSAVPELYPLVRGKKEWRAIILDTTTAAGREPLFETDPVNPFDYLVNKEDDEHTLPHENEVPIVRLCHILSGFPRRQTEEFEKAYAYLDEVTGETATVLESELSEEQLCALREDNFETFRAVYVEKTPSKEKLEALDALEQKYAFNNIRPTQTFLIATRRMVEVNEKRVIEGSWKMHLEYSSSEFWRRNSYPDTCRFLYYNLVNTEHSLYTEQLTKFWLAVVSLAVNNIRSSYLQAYRLYRLDAEVSSAQLDIALNTQLDRMHSALNYVNNALKADSKSPYEEEENIFPEEEIPVSFSAIDGKQLFVKSKSIGLAKDCPSSELDFWHAEMREKNAELTLYLRSPRRAIADAAERTHRRTERFRDEPQKELDRFQIEDLNAYAQQVEDEITGEEFAEMLNEKVFREQLEKADKTVQKEMRSRMYRSHIIQAGVAALVIYFIGFIPYFIKAYQNSNYVFVKSVGFALLTLLPLALGGIIALLVLRSRLCNKIHEYNRVMREIISAVHQCAERFSEYFSKICNYMKVRTMLDSVSAHAKETDMERNRLRLHKRALELTIDRAADVAEAFQIARREQPVVNITSFFNPMKMPTKSHIYRFPVFSEEGTLQVNNTGDFINRPYAFVERLIIEREDIFDMGAE